MAAVTSLVFRSFEFVIEGKICESHDFSGIIHSHIAEQTAVHRSRQTRPILVEHYIRSCVMISALLVGQTHRS